MRVSPDRFSRDLLAALPESERNVRLGELEMLANAELRRHQTLRDFQQELYDFIEQLTAIGHFLGRWEYDCEVEIWGGRSYMDSSAEDELLLRSEFPNGVRLAWKDYELLDRPLA